MYELNYPNIDFSFLILEYANSQSLVIHLLSNFNMNDFTFLKLFFFLSKCNTVLLFLLNVIKINILSD